MLLRNNFSSGPAGTTISVGNSANGDDDPWSFVSITGANSAGTYELSPSRPTAEYVGNLSTGAATGHSVIAWTPGGSFSQVYTRIYAWYAVAPNNFTSPVICYFESSLGQAAAISVNSSGSNQIICSNKNNTQTSMSTWGITAGQWFRIEAHVTFGTPASGAIECRIFGGADVDATIPTETISVSGWDMGAATAINFYYGYVFNDTNLEAFQPSGIELNDTGFPGPLPYKTKAVPGIQPSAIAIHNDVF